MTRKRNNKRPQGANWRGPAEQTPRNYRDANVNFPSTLADNVSHVRIMQWPGKATAQALGRMALRKVRFAGETL